MPNLIKKSWTVSSMYMFLFARVFTLVKFNYYVNKMRRGVRKFVIEEIEWLELFQHFCKGKVRGLNKFYTFSIENISGEYFSDEIPEFFLIWKILTREVEMMYQLSSNISALHFISFWRFSTSPVVIINERAWKCYWKNRKLLFLMLLLTSSELNVFTVAILVLTVVMLGVVGRLLKHRLHVAVGTHPDGANIVFWKRKTTLFTFPCYSNHAKLTSLVTPF